MTFSVHLTAVSMQVPQLVRDRILETVRDIARAAEAVPEGSAFWPSMRASVLQVEVLGWRAGYRIEPALRRIEIVHLAPIPGPGA